MNVDAQGEPWGQHPEETNNYLASQHIVTKDSTFQAVAFRGPLRCALLIFLLYQYDLHSSFVNNVKSFPQICMQNPHNQYSHLHDHGKHKKSLIQVDPRVL